MKGRNVRVWSVVSRIPRGRVATYGQVARLSGLGDLARQVGYALHALPTGSPVPWHRVVNAQGRISRRARAGPDLEQRLRLEIEGVRFDARGRIPLKIFGWRPAARGSIRVETPTPGPSPGRRAPPRSPRSRRKRAE